jgi:hypothetical protein
MGDSVSHICANTVCTNCAAAEQFESIEIGQQTIDQFGSH